MYIWQKQDWPGFRWDEAALRARLDSVRMKQGRLLGRAEAVPRQADLDVEMDALIQNAIRTSEIEGEHLDADSGFQNVNLFTELFRHYLLIGEKDH